MINKSINKIKYKSINKSEKIHSLNLFIILLLNIIFIMLSTNFNKMISYFILSLIIQIYSGLKWNDLKNTAQKVFIFTLFYALLYFIQSEGSFNYQISLLDKAFYFQPRMEKTVFVFSRLFLTSLLSIGSLHVINHEIALLYLCQKKWAPNKLIYPVLLALNSIQNLQRHYDLLVFNAKLRQLKGWVQPQILFQFIIHAIRLADTAALSLQTRHLHEKKLYYYPTEFKKKDSVVFIINFTALVFILLF